MATAGGGVAASAGSSWGGAHEANRTVKAAGTKEAVHRLASYAAGITHKRAIAGGGGGGEEKKLQVVQRLESFIN